MLKLQKQWIGQSGIYQIRSKRSNVRYIGQSTDLYIRIRDHISALKRGKNSSYTLQELFNCHGVEGLEVKVLMYVDSNKLNYCEQLVIDLFLKYGIPLANKVSNGTTTYVQGGCRLPTTTSVAVMASVIAKRCNSVLRKQAQELGREAIKKLRTNKVVEKKRKIKAGLAQRRAEVRKHRSVTLKRLSENGKIPRFEKGHTPHNIYEVIHIPTNTEFSSVSEAAKWANVSIATMSRWVNGRIENGKQIRPKHRDWCRKNIRPDERGGK